MTGSSPLRASASSAVSYPKRLIEVDLPIKRISAHARREKSIRHGHISTLHIWWARRPLAACRAVICAALWPDPADENCPQPFRDKAARLINEFARKADGNLKLLETSSEESKRRWAALVKTPLDPRSSASLCVLRGSLLDFIADFANWDNSTVREYLDTSRALTQAAHEALGGAPGTRPLVVDPFAGGGSIPLEALRVGADAFASDLNPVAVLLNKVVLEYIPKYGQRLADEVRKWGEWIKREAEKELAEFYPRDADGATPIAYLWARTVQCEGPGCGAEVPLVRSLWLAKRGKSSVGFRLVPRPREKRLDFEIINDASAKDVERGTVQHGSATCPVCGFTTPVRSVRQQLKQRHGGAADARLFCVVTDSKERGGQSYRLPLVRDLEAVKLANATLEERKHAAKSPLSLVPQEMLDIRGIRHTWAMVYGLVRWDDYFLSRQALALAVLSRCVQSAADKLSSESGPELAAVVQTCLALTVDKIADYGSSITTWMPRGTARDTFARQAIPIVWDFVEANPISGFHCAWSEAYQWVAEVCCREAAAGSALGQAELASATTQRLPDDSAHALVTDPPYYDAVPYAYLSDFFYVWLRRNLIRVHPSLFSGDRVPKDSEIVVDRPHELSNSTHDIAFYESELTKAFADGRRVLRPDGVAVVVFASKTTASWEAVLKAVIDAGWIITASWPIDTEREARMAAQGQARLASSVHLVCRPRENPDGSVRTDEVGDWRDVLAELPRRIHQWMPRLAEEGVVGADAIFACLGPALEIYSRYSRVETASGEVVPLGDKKDATGKVLTRGYLSYVWEAVAKEALSMIFAGASSEGFEPDGRLTAMWLWTLGGRQKDEGGRMKDEEEQAEDEEDKEESSSFILHPSSFILEYDAARKIAQGLGAHLEQLTSVVEVKGDKARLLPVAERTKHLFGKAEGGGRKDEARKRAKKPKQGALFETLEEVEADAAPGAGEKGAPALGDTVLDRIHQSMILFAAGRSEALKRFLVEDGVGRDARYWRLAQALSALYPAGTDEKRWVDGVLARKKGLGL